MMKGFITLDQLFIIVLGVGYICMVIYIFLMSRSIEKMKKQNATDHTKLYNNQKGIATELSQILVLTRGIRDDVKANSQLLKKKMDDIGDANKIINTLRLNAENAQKKIEKYDQLIKTLMNKINASNTPNFNV